MRISDWSSDVCSSYLPGACCDGYAFLPAAYLSCLSSKPEFMNKDAGIASATLKGRPLARTCPCVNRHRQPFNAGIWDNRKSDRKSVVSGKSVSVRVDLGGRRTIQKKKQRQTKK